MNLRTSILTEIHQRVAAELGASSIILLAVSVDLKVSAGVVVAGVFPAPEDYWDEATMSSRHARQFSVIVQVARARKPAEKEIDSWSEIEDVSERVQEVVLGDSGDLGGRVASIDLGGIDPSEKPVGGVGVGLDIEFICRYVS